MNINAVRVELYKKYIVYLSNHLNKIHNLNKSQQYWSLLIGPWLLNYICHTDSIYRKKKRPSNVLIDENWIVPFDFISSILLFDNKKYQAQLEASYLERGLIFPRLNKVCIKESVQDDKYKSIIKNLLELALSRFVKDKIVVIDGMLSLKQLFSITIKSRFRIIPFFLKRFDLDSLILSNSKRNWKETIDISSNYEQCLHKSILTQMPYVYLEGFPQLTSSVKNISSKSIVSATGWSANERMKVIAAEIKEGNGKVVGLQHGGGPYGIINCPLVDLEVNNTSFFLTWGWGDGIKEQPFYSFKLSRLHDRKKYNDSNKNILYIGTSGSRFFPDELGLPSGEVFKKGYIDWQHRFLKALSNNARKNIIVRISPDDSRFCWNQKDKILALGLDVQIDHHDYLQSISRASLIISDNAYTTFFEAIAANIPVFLFLNEDMWGINKDAFLLFQEMEMVGMYRSNPESAARQVDIISLDVKSWWNSNKVVQVRNKILNKYARGQDNITDLFVDKIINDS